MNEPEVTVVIPCYNRAAYVGAAIDSVAGQTRTSWQLIVVDDGSTDDTAVVVREKIDELQREGRAARMIRLSSNQGVTIALKTAFESIQSRYFTYLGSDDLWEPEKLDRQISAVEAAGESIGGCFCDCWVIDESGRRIDRMGRIHPHYRGGDIFLDLLLFRFVPPSPGNFFVTEKVREVGGFNEHNPVEDFDLWVRLTRRFPVVYLDEPLARYRVHGGNMSSGDPTKLFHATVQTLEEIIALDPRASPLRRRIIGAAQTRYAGAFFNDLDLPRARLEALRALRWAPRNPVAWRILFGTMLGRAGVSRVRGLLRRRRQNRREVPHE